MLAVIANRPFQLKESDMHKTDNHYLKSSPFDGKYFRFPFDVDLNQQPS